MPPPKSLRIWKEHYSKQKLTKRDLRVDKSVQTHFPFMSFYSLKKVPSSAFSMISLYQCSLDVLPKFFLSHKVFGLYTHTGKINNLVAITRTSDMHSKGLNIVTGCQSRYMLPCLGLRGVMAMKHLGLSDENR